VTSLDDLDLVAQCRAAAYVLAAVARTFRDIDRPAMSDQCVTLAIWFHDLAHDLESILKEQP